MRFSLPRLLALAVGCLLPGLAAPARAQQSSPDTAPVQFGSVALSPGFRLVNLGWDSNVLYQPESADPQGDMTAIFAPSLDAWVRRNRVRLSGRGELDFNYFNELSAIRSVDQDYRGRLELALGRVTPFVEGSWINARHRRNYEIDAPIRRLDSVWQAGADVSLSGKTALGFVLGRSRVDYADTGTSAEPDLSTLDAVARTRGVYLKYAVTPLTTMRADVVGDEVRVPESPDRDSNGYRLSGSMEFRPLALVSGRAEAGVRHREYEMPAVEPFTGVVAQAALTCTLLSRTRVSAQFQHDLSQSYRTDYVEYMQTGLSVVVEQRLTADWDLTGTIGRYNLDYGVATASGQPAAPSERVVSYGAEVGYRLGNARVAGGFMRQDRVAASSASRLYDRTVIASSVTYAF